MRLKQLWKLMGENKYSKEDIIEILKTTKKPIKYTHGLGYRNPTIHKVDCDKEEAIEIFNKRSSMCDIDEYEDYIHLNTYSGNDLF